MKFIELYIFILSCLMVGCISCSSFKTMDIKPIDAEFDQHVSKYEDLKVETLKVKMKNNISILFHSLPSPTIGICYWISNGSREIYIDPGFWFAPTTSELDRELLIFHELGHCDLDRGHSDPLSIMEPYHIGGLEYSLDLNYYRSELFNEKLRKAFMERKFDKPRYLSPISSCGGIHEKQAQPGEGQ